MSNNTISQEEFDRIKEAWVCIGWSWSGEPLMWENPNEPDEYFNIEDWIVE